MPPGLWSRAPLLVGEFEDAGRDGPSAKMRLSTRDVSALEHLLERPELGPADIASLLGISTASATVLIDRLETAGHVQRQPHPDDRRRKSLVVTEHANTQMFATLQPLTQMLMAIDNDYRNDESAVIESYLRKVSDAYARYIDQR